MSFLRFWKKVVGFGSSILSLVNVFRRVKLSSFNKSKKQKILGCSGKDLEI